MGFKILLLCAIELFTFIDTEAIYNVVGDDLKLVCSEHSFVNWFQGDMKLENTDRILMTTNITDGVVVSSLIVLGFNNSDEGIYQCKTKATDVVHEEIDVRAVEIAGSRVPLNATENEIDLQCLVQTNISFQPIRWERDGEPVSNSSMASRYTVLNLTAQDANQTILRIESPEEKDLGSYTCVVELIDSNQTLRHEAIIAMKPKVELVGTLKIKVEDETSRIECKVKGYPIPTIKWYRTLEQDEAKEMEIEYNDKISVQPNADGIPDALLVVKELKIKEDRGYYKCVATNYLGTDETSAHLKVKDKNAAVWPFLGICVEVITLCCIIFIFEKRRNKRMEGEEDEEVDAVKQNLVNGNGSEAEEEKLELRQRNGNKSS